SLIEHAILHAVKPRTGAGVEEIDASARALPPELGLPAVDVEVAVEAFLELRVRPRIDIAAHLDVEARGVHVCRRPEHDLHVLLVKLVDEAGEAGITRRVRLEGVVVRLPRAIEDNDADR